MPMVTTVVQIQTYRVAEHVFSAFFAVGGIVDDHVQCCCSAWLFVVIAVTVATI